MELIKPDWIHTFVERPDIQATQLVVEARLTKTCLIPDMESVRAKLDTRQYAYQSLRRSISEAVFQPVIERVIEAVRVEHCHSGAALNPRFFVQPIIDLRDLWIKL